MDAPENVLLVRHGKDRVAIDLAAVREILRMVALKALPGAPPGVIGVLSLRGETIAVIDLEQRLPAGDATAPGIDHHLVVLSGTAVPLAIAVAEVVDIEALPAADWRTAADALPPGVPVSGVARFGADPVAVLDPGVLLEKGEVMALKEAMRRLREAKPEQGGKA